jgi:hypothetical protein
MSTIRTAVGRGWITLGEQVKTQIDPSKEHCRSAGAMLRTRVLRWAPARSALVGP